MKKKLFYGCIFLLFIIILFLSPISGDDWGNYLEGVKGIRHCLGQTIGMYFSWEGRIISRLLINLLTCNKILWNVINTCVIISIVYFTIKLINPKNRKIIYLLSLLIILLMNIFTFSEVIVWVAGNITYLFVIPIVLSYFYYLFDYNKKNKLLVILFSIFNFIIPMFIEHIAIILIFSNLLIFIYRYIKTKKFDKELLLYLIISIISTLIVLLSPGTKVRMGMENIYFSKLSFIDKIIYNIPNFIYYTFIVNYYLILLIVIANNYLIKKHIKNNLCRYILLIVNIMPVTSMINYILNSLSISKFTFFMDYSNKLIILYYIFYLFMMVYLIIIDTINDKNKKIIFFFIIGILSNVVMMVSPIWGYRTSFATYVFLSISSIMIIDKYIKEKNLYNYVILIICIFSYLFYLILYINVHRQYIDNLKLINICKKNKCKELELLKYPYYVSCNINPDNSFHIYRFKKYYNLDTTTDIILRDSNWKYFIIYNK